MNDFEAIKEKYMQIGMKENNIDYAIDAVKFGTERHLIIKNLTSAAREELEENAEQLINDLIDNIKGRKRRSDKNSYYSARQKKIYDDYRGLSNERLLEYIQNSNKYQDDVINVIRDILIERNVFEGKPTSAEASAEIKGPEKQRHPFITGYLVLAILANVFVIISSFVLSTKSDDNAIVNGTPVIMLMLIIVSLMNIYFITKILDWKKYGFKGLGYLSVFMFLINLFLGTSLTRSLLGLLGIVILYFVLQIKKNEVSAWEQLE